MNEKIQNLINRANALCEKQVLELMNGVDTLTHEDFDLLREALAQVEESL